MIMRVKRDKEIFPWNAKILPKDLVQEMFYENSPRDLVDELFIQGLYGNLLSKN